MNLDEILTFLVDTQADVSVIKHKTINFDIKIDKNDTINIKGVTDGNTSTLGRIALELDLDKYPLQHKFHVVTDEFNMPSDGILGKDFIKKYKCIINYKNYTVSFKVNNFLITIPIFHGPNEHP